MANDPMSLLPQGGPGGAFKEEKNPTGPQYPWMRGWYGREDREGNVEKNAKGYVRQYEAEPNPEDPREIRNALTQEVLYTTTTQRNGTFREALLDEFPLHRSVMAGADLRGLGAGLHDMILDRGNFREAVFDGADLRRSSLANAKLKGASLRGVKGDNLDLHGADMREAVLTGSFRNANFRGVDLRGGKIEGDITGASFAGAILDDGDAEEFKELKRRIMSGNY